MTVNNKLVFQWGVNEDHDYGNVSIYNEIRCHIIFVMFVYNKLRVNALHIHTMYIYTFKY